MRNWFSVADLAGQQGMPSTERGVRKMATRLGWQGRRRAGSKAMEYKFNELPPCTQNSLLASSVADATPVAPLRLLL